MPATICPKCDERRGRRYCPALDTMICPQCCAEHRLETIRCPSDCEYLQGETYQFARRRKKAQSSGRHFVEKNIRDLFRSDENRDFAFLIQADAFWWMRKNGRLTNERCALSYEDVRGKLSAVYVPTSVPLPLARFLHRLLEEGPRHRKMMTKTFTDRHRRSVLETLARHARSRGAADGHDYYDELDAYFGRLDFEADLDYSPAEELEEDPEEPRDGFSEGSGGLIVPGS